MVIYRHLCEKCLGYMKIEKIENNYFLICPDCERKNDDNEDI